MKFHFSVLFLIQISKFYTDNIFLGTAANFAYVVRNDMHLYTNAQFASSFFNYIALSIEEK